MLRNSRGHSIEERLPARVKLSRTRVANADNPASQYHGLRLPLRRSFESLAIQLRVAGVVARSLA